MAGRVGSPTRSSEEFVGAPIIGVLIATFTLITVIAVASSDKNENQSPG